MAEPEPAPAGLADAVLLAPLTEDSFLHNLHVRYKRDIIYTYVGNALVSVNPCRALPLYSAELVRTYLARPPYLLPPHLYAITATAYRWVRDRNENQCIVITGESGAGKTEAARVCLQCAVVAGGGGGGALAAAGTLLEAFGNAATARNHNASRFGKLLDIEFDFKGEPVGGHITHYLLEKERVCRAAEGERNFHVLYQLLAGADAHLLKRLKLQRSWEQYRVLRGGAGCAEGACAGCAECAGAAGGAGGAGGGASPRRAPPHPPPGPRAPQADRDHFAFTKAAMGALGFSAGQCGAVLRLLAFLLKLGNVQFEPQHNIDGSIGTRLQHEYELREACMLVGVEADALVSALGAAPPLAAHEDGAPHEAACSVEDECSSEAGSETEGAGAEWARALRDRLLCALYSRLFTWLVNAVNDAIKPAVVGARRSLGILDVYGLESLTHNGLERLLINYAAERVQAAVTAATLRREQEEYAREGLAWTPLPYADHELYADLLDAGPESVLGVLRECSMRGTSDAVFLQRLQRRRHPRLLVLPPDRFQVVHFGGAVAYSARGVVQKNRDALCRRCAAVLAAAREPLLAALFAPGAAAYASSAGSPRRPCALACRQRALVGALVRRLPPAPRLVRCLRADAALRPHRFDGALLRHQIRTQGIMDMALLRRAGWCESMCARSVLARYGVLRARAGAAAPGSPAERDEPVRAARALLRSLPIPSAEFAYGRTKVFIRSPRTVWELEALRAARVEALVCAAQRAWRRHRARARLRAAARIARAWRRHRRRRAAPSAPAAPAPAPPAVPKHEQRGGAERGRRCGKGRGGGRHASDLARVVRARAARLPRGAVGAAAGAAPLAGLRRLAALSTAAASRPHGRIAAPSAPPLALPPLPSRFRPDGEKSDARESHRERALQGSQAQLRAERRPPFRRRLREIARLRGLASRARRRRRRPIRCVRGRGGQGGALERPRVALPGRRIHGRAAAARGALATTQAPRARALRVPPVAVALRRRPARRARARVRRARELHGGAVAVLLARAAGRAGLPVRRRGRVAATRRPASAHVPRARAGHQAVPGGAERRGRAATRERRHRVRGELRAADGDGVLPRGGRRGGRRRRAPAAARQPHGRAAVSGTTAQSVHVERRARTVSLHVVFN